MFFFLPPRGSHKPFLLWAWPWARMMINVLASLQSEPNVEGSLLFLLEEMAFGGSNRMSRCWPWLWTSRPPPPSLLQHLSNVRWLKLIQDPENLWSLLFFPSCSRSFGDQRERSWGHNAFPMVCLWPQIDCLRVELSEVLTMNLGYCVCLCSSEVWLPFFAVECNLVEVVQKKKKCMDSFKM